MVFGFDMSSGRRTSEESAVYLTVLAFCSSMIESREHVILVLFLERIIERYYFRYAPRVIRSCSCS